MLNFFKTKTVDSITANLRKTVEELRLHTSVHIENSTNKQAQAAQLHQEAAEHQGEAIKAHSVADKIGALLA